MAGKFAVFMSFMCFFSVLISFPTIAIIKLFIITSTLMSIIVEILIRILTRTNSV